MQTWIVMEFCDKGSLSARLPGYCRAAAVAADPCSHLVGGWLGGWGGLAPPLACPHASLLHQLEVRPPVSLRSTLPDPAGCH